MNLAESCFNRRIVACALTFACVIAGVLSYFRLGRLEDPEFTIRAAQVLTAYPGASAREVAEQVTDPIETAVQRLGGVKHVTSTSYPGKSIVLVEMDDSFTGKQLPQVWDELRRKVGDMVAQLPDGCSKPLVYDDYGDVYGVFYAISGDGFSYAELKEHAKLLRRELLLCSDVAKVDMLGTVDEIVWLEIPTAKIAALKVTPQEIQSALQGQNVPVDAGALRVDDKLVRIVPTGKVASIADLGEVMVRPGLYLSDIATIRRGYDDLPRALVRRNGKPCIGLGISTAKGGNVVRMGEAVEKRMHELLAQTPIGIEVDVIAHQATSVTNAVNGFVVNLVESVLLVIAVLLFTMGMRSGLIIGAVLLVTVLATVFVMDLAGIMFERISLGAFIIALGMLVDNAIVITEAVLVAANRGESKRAAACAVVKQTQWALLGGTAIAILSFAPIGASQNASGEYCRSLFLVIGISLLLSWIAALTVTPLLAERFLAAAPQKGGPAADPYGGAFFRGYRRFLEACIDNRGLTVFALVCLLVMSVIGFGRVKQNFFPASTRPQFMVHVWLPEGTNVNRTQQRVEALAQAVRGYAGVTGVTSFAGQGAMRFLLTYTPEDADSAYGLLLVDLDSDSRIDALTAKIATEAPELAPDAEVSCQRFVLGPGDPDKIQVRVIGEDPEILRTLGVRIEDVLRADGHVRDIKVDWRNRAETWEPIISAARLRRLGLTRVEAAQAFRTAIDGYPVGAYLEGDETLPIVMRTPSAERADPMGVVNAWGWSARLGIAFPIAQFLDGATCRSEELRLRRRDRRYCLTVKGNPRGDETANAVFTRLMPALEKAAADFPAGYRVEWGGEYEDAKEANATLAPSYLPIFSLMLLIVLALFNSVRKTAVIFLTLPLVLVGVVAGLLLFDAPFGFMALLGLLSLVGMQVKNAIVLMDEISANLERGLTPYAAIVESGVSRLRPVANASLTTVLGMLPLLADAFYSAMAVTIMVGLSFATVLTMVVIPVNYAVIFKVRRDK